MHFKKRQIDISLLTVSIIFNSDIDYMRNTLVSLSQADICTYMPLFESVSSVFIMTISNS